MANKLRSDAHCQSHFFGKVLIETQSFVHKKDVLRNDKLKGKNKYEHTISKL